MSTNPANRHGYVFYALLGNEPVCLVNFGRYILQPTYILAVKDSRAVVYRLCIDGVLTYTAVPGTSPFTDQVCWIINDVTYQVVPIVQDPVDHPDALIDYVMCDGSKYRVFPEVQLPVSKYLRARMTGPTLFFY